MSTLFCCRKQFDLGPAPCPFCPRIQLCPKKCLLNYSAVTQVLPDTLFRVARPNGQQVPAHISSKLRKNFIRMFPCQPNRNLNLNPIASCAGPAAMPIHGTMRCCANSSALRRPSTTVWPGQIPEPAAFVPLESVLARVCRTVPARQTVSMVPAGTACD